MIGAALHHYDATARALHWGMALLLPVQIAMGFVAERVDDPSLAAALLGAHFQLGMLLLALVAIRILWRLVFGRRPGRDDPVSWHRRTAAAVHLVLYALLLALPASGYVIWVWMDAPRSFAGVVDVPALFTPPPHDESSRALAWYIHYYGAWSLLALVALHITGAMRMRGSPRNRPTLQAHASRQQP